jgi:hypothetical protein
MGILGSTGHSLEMRALYEEADDEMDGFLE